MHKILLAALCWATLRAQDSSQLAERASLSVALVLAKAPGAEGIQSTGAAFAIRENGILLTAYHVVKGAATVQVRFKNGEVFDDVQLLGS